MFWVALATLIMAMTGKGDDTRFWRDFMEELGQAVTEEVPDPKRQAVALDAVKKTELLFRTHRTKLGLLGDCLEAADRNYEATEADYKACFEGNDDVWETGVDDLLTQRGRFREAIHDDEYQRISERLGTRK